LAKEGQVKWASKISKRCLNVQKILNLPVSKECLESDVLNFQFISKMSNVSNVSVNFQHFSPVVLMILADMGNLSRLEVSNVPISRAFRDTVQIKEIDVTSLKCDSLLFINFCNPGHLSVLNLDCMRTTADEYVSALKGLPNLRELSLEFYQPWSTESVLKVVTFVAQVPEIIQFSLGLVFKYCREEADVLNLLSHHHIRKCLHRLQICSVSEDWVALLELCLGQLKELRLLTLEYVPCETGKFLHMMPNLVYLKIVSWAYQLRVYESCCNVKISYERCVDQIIQTNNYVLVCLIIISQTF